MLFVFRLIWPFSSPFLHSPIIRSLVFSKHVKRNVKIIHLACFPRCYRWHLFNVARLFGGWTLEQLTWSWTTLNRFHTRLPANHKSVFTQTRVLWAIRRIHGDCTSSATSIYLLTSGLGIDLTGCHGGDPKCTLLMCCRRCLNHPAS